MISKTSLQSAKNAIYVFKPTGRMNFEDDSWKVNQCEVKDGLQRGCNKPEMKASIDPRRLRAS